MPPDRLFHRPIHQRLNRECGRGLYGLLLQFPMLYPDDGYEITWASGPLLLPFPSSTSSLDLGSGTERLSVCKKNITLLVDEMDPRPEYDEKMMFPFALHTENHVTTSCQQCRSRRPQCRIVIAQHVQYVLRFRFRRTRNQQGLCSCCKLCCVCRNTG